MNQFYTNRKFLTIILLLFESSNGLLLVNDSCPSLQKIECQSGILIPVWKPVRNLSIPVKISRSIIYFLCLLYCFLGVSIIADRFMSSIEVITSKEKEIVVQTKSGESHTISVRIWNETVSNLTLMALGSSAPEILLSIIEICGNNFEAGDLGPGTIIGSAAFNLFIIIGFCISIIPKGSVRRIKHLSVFFVTTTWSIFAYLWLYFIIAISSPNIVSVWEASLTFLFFPITVISAYVADIKIFQKKFLKKRFATRRMKRAKEGDKELQERYLDIEYPISGKSEAEDEFERTRLEYIETIKNIRKTNPTIDTKELEELAKLEVLNKGPKSRAFYRIQATRQLTGGGNVLTKAKLERHLSQLELSNDDQFGSSTQQIFMDPGLYTVMENVGRCQINVARKGGDLSSEICVDYKTEDGTALANSDYVPSSGTIIFKAYETSKCISISIIDDDIFEEDEHFTVKLSNPQILRCTDPLMNCLIVDPSFATIMILDDDHSGIFQFESDSVNVNEACGTAQLKVYRTCGGRGVVKLPYKTIEGTARGNGQDYSDTYGEIIFQNDQTEAVISVPIIDDNDYEKEEFFYLELGEPIILEKEESRTFLSKFQRRRNSSANTESSKIITTEKDTKIEKIGSIISEVDSQEVETGKPRLGEHHILKINICESVEFKNTVDRLIKQGKWALVVGTTSWKEQFVDAITVNAGGNDATDEEEFKLPACSDYIMHFLTVFWKVLFSFVPPTHYAGGWVCFVVSIIAIGFLTAIIGDLASSFGCSVGLTDAVTATTFVALGTSLPDMFASKVAATGDQYADSSIGNVTGSNAVNVFLGIGVAWTIAAIVHVVRGTEFRVPAGSIGFSVTIYCIFAVTSIVVLVLRRRKAAGGELGGDVKIKYASSAYFFLLWSLYVLLTALENYCHIAGF